MPNKLFDDNSEDEADKVNKLAINKDYADKYGKWRQKEDYERLKAKFGVKDFDSENSDSEESEDEEYVEPDNPEFDMDFFRVLAAIRTKHPILEEKDKFFKDSYQSKGKSKEEKPLLVAEYERKHLLEKSGKYDDDYSVKQGPSRLVKENESILNSKEKFKFDDNLSDDDDAEDLFTTKENDNAVEEEEEMDNEAVEFLKGKRKDLSNKVDEELLGALKNDWKSNMSKEDTFLMDYFVNKRYLEEEDETKERADNHCALDFEPLEDDEETYSKMEEYETKYRFRFEEPDQDFIHRYPRVIEDTVRKKDIKRKEERDKKKNKLKEEEERNKQEFLRLKALKKQEIMERIDMLKEAAGIENDVNPSNFDLEADFDPEQHDKLMSQVFNDNYYNEEGETEKPKFEDEEFQRELEEEYEKLKELDNMAEGTFKYADVVSNSYGLKTEEILFAKDTELNRWCSINRILKYGQAEFEEKKIKKNFENRGANDHIKFKILPSLYADNIEEHWEAEEERRRKRNLKKKERKNKKLLKIGEGEPSSKPSKVNSENEGTSKTAENNDFESEKLGRTDSTDDTTGNEQSILKSSEESLGEQKKKRKKKQKLNDSNTSIGKYSENESSETCYNIQECITSGDHAVNSLKSVNKISKIPDGNLENTLKKEKKKKKNKKENENYTEKFGNSDLKCNDETIKNISAEKFDELSEEANNKEMKDQSNAVQIPTKSKKRKMSKSDENSEAKIELNKKRKFFSNTLEKRGQLEGISDERLLAYGQNPKKIRKSLKYSSKFN